MRARGLAVPVAGGALLAVGAALVAAGALLLAASAAQAAGSAPSSPLPPAQVRELAPQVRDLTPRIVDLRPKASGASLTVGTDVLFAFDSATLSSDAEAVLGQVVQRLHTARAGTVTIAGHTDSIGTPQYNLGLSLRRARSVQAYLQAHVGNPALHYRATGKGEANPVAPNTLPDGQDNADGRRQNRRVVIITGP